MFQWDRNTVGRLVRTSIPQEQGCELNLNSDRVESPPEEQQSQQGNQRKLNAYMSMRDHIHPSRVSAPSCIIPPTKDMIVRPYISPLLPTFDGMECENPYSHIWDFEEVCNTFKEDATNLDLMRLTFFHLTLKDKAKIWLNSLWVNTSHQLMPHIAAHITLIGGTILTSPGNQSLHHMYPLLHNNSMVPHLKHNPHHHHLQLSRL